MQTPSIDPLLAAGIIASQPSKTSLTPASIEDNILSEHYFTAWQGAHRAYWSSAGKSADTLQECIAKEPASDGPLSLLTICVLILRNGFTVIGTSACVDPKNFNEQTGKDIARKKAIENIWPLMGYVLKQEMHERNK
jgi:hypothetical protein